MIEQADIRSVLARLSKKWKDRQMRVTAVNLNIADHMYTDDARACLRRNVFMSVGSQD